MEEIGGGSHPAAAAAFQAAGESLSARATRSGRSGTRSLLTVTHKEKPFDVTNETTSLRRMSTSAGRSKLHHLLLRCVSMVLSVARCDWYRSTRQNNVGGPMSISNIVPCAFTPASQTNDLSQHPADVSLDWVKCVDFLCADEPAVLQPAITCVEGDPKSASIRGNISIRGRKSSVALSLVVSGKQRERVAEQRRSVRHSRLEGDALI